VKFSVEYVKKNPVLFGVILIVFGLGFYLLLNRGGSAAASQGSGTTVVNAGPSDAEIQAGVASHIADVQAASASQQNQLQLAALQTQGGVALQLADLDAQYKALELASNERVADKSLDVQTATLNAQLDNARGMSADANAFMLAYAQTQANTATTQLAIGANLQRDLSAQQLQAFQIGTMASLATSLKSKGLAHSFFDNSLMPASISLTAPGPAMLPASSLIPGQGGAGV
jgi:hypothetical protein